MVKYIPASSVSVAPRQKVLKVYSDRNYVSPRQEAHCAMMTPFWGIGESTSWYEPHGVFNTYASEGGQYFELVDRLQDADLAILPSTFYRYLVDGAEQIAFDFAKIAAAADKPLVVFNERDFDFKFPFPNAYLFSPTIEGPRGPREFGLPGWIPDHLGDDPLPIRTKEATPVVGFCGWVPEPNLYGHAKRFARGYMPLLDRKRKSSISASVRESYRHRFLRAEIIGRLHGAPQIESNFLLRNVFFGGAKATVNGKQDWDKRAIEANIADFTSNMIGSDYILNVRGKGNFSFRFYETLAFGRLPVLVDTKCVLPYDFAIDWRDEILWIDYAERSNIAQRIATYHEHLSPAEFEGKQLRLRKLWEEYLSPAGFFRNFHLHFPNISG